MSEKDREHGKQRGYKLLTFCGVASTSDQSFELSRLGHTEVSERDREYGKQLGYVLITFCCVASGRRWS